MPLGPVGELVELVAAVLGGAGRDADALDRRHAGERLELGRGEDLGQLDELEAEAQVGLVDAEPVHRLVPRDALDRLRPLPRRRLGGGEHGFADGVEHVVLADEAHLHVELHELVLPVGAQVLVAQAAGHLVVAVDAGHHQELLEQLRRLRQGVERARLLARRHEELAGAFGRRRHEHRRLDLDETLGVHGVADGGVDRRADAQVLLHPLTTQVEVAVLEADVLVDVVGAGVDRERRRVGLAQHLDDAVADLDLAGREAGVDGPLRTLADDAGDPHDVLAAHVDVVVDDALDDARVVAQVDEGEVLTVLAAATHPAADADGLADVRRAQVAAQVGAHRSRLRRGARSSCWWSSS